MVIRFCLEPLAGLEPARFAPLDPLRGLTPRPLEYKAFSMLKLIANSIVFSLKPHSKLHARFIIVTYLNFDTL